MPGGFSARAAQSTVRYAVTGVTHSFIACTRAAASLLTDGTLAGVTVATLLSPRRRVDPSLARRLLPLQAPGVAVVVPTAPPGGFPHARQAVRQDRKSKRLDSRHLTNT